MRFHLFGNRESGHSYKIALALSLSDQRFEYTHIDLALPREARPEPFRSMSRYGEVPLLLVDGVPQCQSDAILLALSEMMPELAIRPEDVQQIREWLFWEANRIGFSVPNLRFALGWAPQTPTDVLAWLRARVASDLVRLDHELAARPFLLGPHWSIADIACAAYLYWPEHLGSEISYPVHVASWLKRLADRPGWQHPYDLLG